MNCPLQNMGRGRDV
uniref:Uncharacterized protein n=1 Tax=Anguilla anguilla TaxID=7936 RepID=A0A0E9QMJ1_ANGAN